jgi:hypothetical protein
MVLEIERNLRLNGRAKESKQPVVVAKKVQTPKDKTARRLVVSPANSGQSSDE